MMNIFIPKLIGETVVILGEVLLQSIPSPIESVLPAANLTIENTIVSPIDDHLCYGCTTVK